MIAACFALSVIMGLVWNVFALLLVEMQTDTGWSLPDLSAGFSLFVLSYTIATPLVAHLASRFGSRIVAFGLSLIFCIGFIGAASTATLWIFYIFYGLIAGVGSLAFSSLLIFTLLLQRFRRNGTTAVALADSGTGLGMVVGFPAMYALLDVAGWRGVLLCLAVAGLVFGVGLHALLPNVRRNSAPRASLALPQNVPLWSLVSLMGSVFAGALVLQGYQTHQVALLENVGTDRASAVYAVSLMAGVMTVWRALSGICVDRFGARRIMIFCLFWTGFAAASLWWFFESLASPLLALGVIGFALGLGSQGIVLAAATRSLAKGPEFIQAYGAVRLSAGLGLMVGPALAGFTYGLTGDYDMALVLFLGAAVLHFSLFFAADPNAVRRRRN